MPVELRSEGVARRSVSNRRVKESAERMLAAIGREADVLSVLLCGDELIHELNRDFRDKDKPTDVLAFALNEGEAVAAPKGAIVLLGDVVISIDTARRQAEEHKVSIAFEVRNLLAHGLLHLLGYDHQTPETYRRMMALQAVLRTA